MRTKEAIKPASAPSSEAPIRRDADAPPALVRKFSAGVAVMVFLTLLASCANYASNVIFARLLDPTGFGELTSLLALAVIVAVPTGAAQTVIAERVAVYNSRRDTDTIRYLVRHALAHFAVIGLVVGTVYVACIPLVFEGLGLEHWGPAAALAPVIGLGFVFPLALGLLQGLDRFVAYGLMLLAISLSSIVFGVPWVEAGGGPGGAIGGRAVGMLIVLLTTLILLRKLILPRGRGAARSGLRRKPGTEAVSASAAFVAFAVISNLDIVLAKLFLDGPEVGIYAAIATVGKVVTFLPAAVAVVMVPNAARLQHATGSSARVLRLAGLLVAATAVIAAVPAALAPDLVVDLMFGGDYEAAADGIFPIVVAGTGLALMYLLVVYAVAIRDRNWWKLLIGGVATQVIGVSLFHGSPAEIATVQATTVIGVLLVNEYYAHSIVRPWRDRKRRQRSGSEAEAVDRTSE
jgi:O-antigen/teichoic acid export membrane protein